MVSSFAIFPIARVLLLHGNHSRLIGFKVYVHRFPDQKKKIKASEIPFWETEANYFDGAKCRARTCTGLPYTELMGLTHSISLCIVFSDRVADTCVACDQGGFLRELLFFISGGHCHGKNRSSERSPTKERQETEGRERR